jgi:protein-disulfide isomerase
VASRRWGRLVSPSACIVLACGATIGFVGLAAIASAQTRGLDAVRPVRLSHLSLAGIPQHNDVLGDTRAPIKMLVFNDPQCPICTEWDHNVLPALVKRYVRTGRLQIQWHGFSVIGPESVTGERFIAAAGLQNDLWNVQEDLAANQGEENSGWLNSSLLEQIGASIPGFDVAAAVTAADSSIVTHELAADLLQGEQYGITGVPAIFYGRRGGPLKPLEFTEYTPSDFEKPILRLLQRKERR